MTSAKELMPDDRLENMETVELDHDPAREENTITNKYHKDKLMAAGNTISSMYDDAATDDSSEKDAASFQDGTQQCEKKNDQKQDDGILQRLAKIVARNPNTFFWTSLVTTVALSAFAMIYGEFSVEATSYGFTTRGTMISDRESQSRLLRMYSDYLFTGGDEAWDDLTRNIQPSWQIDDDDDDDGGSESRRKLRNAVKDPNAVRHGTVVDALTKTNDDNGRGQHHLPFLLSDDLQRRLEDTEEFPLATNCDTTLYSSPELTTNIRLWLVWKSQKEGTSILSPAVLHDLCVAEQNTQRILEEQGLCSGCDEGCLPPYSIVLLARMIVDDGFEMSCSQLSRTWEDQHHVAFEQEIQQCVADLKSNAAASGTAASDSRGSLPESCPSYFTTAFVDGYVDDNEAVTYTSSIFITDDTAVDDMYEHVDKFDRGSDLVKGAYDTQYADFVSLNEDEALASDMALAMGSAVIIVIAIMVHTKSPFLTLIGLLQIVFSFPLAFFVYKLILGLDFFPFLNFIGIFVIFALGADDVFVAVDKWKNVRLEHPDASTEAIAAEALPDAAGAMFLTTLTTTVAFFATAICPVAPVKLFAVFCGFLVMLDYMLCVLLTFPSLCIYDIHLQSRQRGDNQRPNICISLSGMKKEQADKDAHADAHVDPDEERDIEGANNADDDQSSFIQRTFTAYYNLLHKMRWVLLVACLGAFGVSTYYASKLGLPESLDVRLLPESVQYEQNVEWRQNLLGSVLSRSVGSSAYVFWGVTPADTGDHNDPRSFTSLVLDETFDPSSEDAQTFLLDFCDKLAAEEFVATTEESDFSCPMKDFDAWLSNANAESDSWSEHCGGANQVPVPQQHFHSCMTSFAQDVGQHRVLSRNGQVKIIYVEFLARVSNTNSDYYDLKDEFELTERWMDTALTDNAPDGVNKGYSTADAYWWYDTHKAMLETAIGSAIIALAASFMVILFSSRSLTLTIFASLSIMYVVASVTATMVAFGWDLGFLESICFAILIGLSADFVTHFAHTYASLKGKINRQDRTKFAIIHMGPSILAGSFTTISAAIIMLFTIVAFFQKFAYVLFFSVIQATIAAFVFFCTVTDCFGPSDPTYLVDRLMSKVFRGRTSNKERTDREDEMDDKVTGSDNQ